MTRSNPLLRRSDSPWEVERDRFGVMFSGPLEVGECIRVVAADELLEALSHVKKLGEDLIEAYEALDMAIHHAENLRRYIDRRPVRDLTESQAGLAKAKRLAETWQNPPGYYCAHCREYRNEPSGVNCIKPGQPCNQPAPPPPDVFPTRGL